MAIFRLRDHTRRLFDSAKIYRINIPFTPEQINDGLPRGGRRQRPDARRLHPPGRVPRLRRDRRGAEDRPARRKWPIAAWEWGKYLGAESEDEGVDVCVSSWQRVAPNTMPALAKAGGNYLSSQLISLEAKRLGFAEGIGLAPDGTVSEGAGENLFLVKDGVLLHARRSRTRCSAASRATRVMRLARDRGIEVREMLDPARDAVHRRRALLHRHGGGGHADPLGRPHPVGTGKRGPITETLQKAFFGLFTGTTADKWGWLDYVDMQPRSARRGVARCLSDDRRRRCSRRSGSGTWSCPRPPTRPRCCSSTCT